MRILRAEIWACDDCTVYLCNGDLSGVDDSRIVKAIEAGCAEQGPGIVPNFDGETNVGIQTDSSDDCQFCGASDKEHTGTLHRFAELGEGPEELDHDGAKEAPIVGSPGCKRYSENLYLMWAGYGTKLFVWADSFESAFEEMVEWLDDNAPGCLTRINWDEAAQDAGYESWADAEAKLDEDELEELRQSAESDLTVVGHTTLTNGDAIASYEWGGNDVTYQPTIEAVRLLTV